MEKWQENALVNIGRLMSEAGAQQGEFAKNAKISPSHFNMVLNGHRPITRQLVSSIAAYVGRQSAWFYESHQKAEPVTTTIDHAISLLEAYRDSDPHSQGIALALLSGNPKHIPTSLPASVHQAVAALLESLKSSR